MNWGTPFGKGHTPWNKGKHGVQIVWNKGKKGVMPTPWNKGIKTGITPWLGKKRPSLKQTNAAKTMFQKGRIDPNKGKRTELTCQWCKKIYIMKKTKSTQKFCSEICFNKFQTGENNPNWQGGKPKCKTCSKIIKWHREYCKNCYKKENHHWWKGGITKENTLIRTSIPYKKWRLKVFERDGYTCRICFIKGGLLHADHIKPFALFPELRLDINNGRTVHAECHKITESYLNNKITKEMYL